MPAPDAYLDFSSRPEPPATLHEPDARVQNLPEAVLQDLWLRQDFDHAGLRTTEGQRVAVIDPGRLNTHAGPDFSGARLLIGDVQWAGDVEIHRTSGEWLVHRHDSNASYDRVVLHVVLTTDRHTGTLRRPDGSALPELVLLPHLADSLRHLLYRFFAHPSPAFPCASRWGEVPDRVRRPWLRLLGQERLRGKVGVLADAYLGTPDLEEVLYRAVMRVLGYAPNADAMERLARLVPLRKLRALRDPADAEALLLGMAGLLSAAPAAGVHDPVTGERVAGLTTRFHRLRTRIEGAPMTEAAWTFARLRPANAPARRIAQAAALFGVGGPLHAEPIQALRQAATSARSRTALRQLVQIEPDPYWRTHIRPEMRCRESPAGIGRERADRLALNALLPVLLLAAEQDGDLALEERVLDVTASFPASDDKIVRLYAEHGYAPNGALETQGIHQLYRTRCTQSRCLRCSVGRWLLER